MTKLNGLRTAAPQISDPAAGQRAEDDDDDPDGFPDFNLWDLG
jgi:hypothetical protein